ncbi:DUF418 domain-containing protein [Stackebrandtia nassauensis]|uniref:DUF418 domain-containing protein n=1 Tax=Stackebrandtia nassauensis (strain DSM 44728 / CIP 108903 / NRRL B-16338 / NBRC 102104 / LLR-40K-21) TaxID=446470 RepID=D3Q781_STANL|nr:DUF418 domain-containing protein [Stackebrandtia nassauensis]ADD42352.1 conserved hypothetical protein [Stackebrandtia nassauensis DSM 44728]
MTHSQLPQEKAAPQERASLSPLNPGTSDDPAPTAPPAKGDASMGRLVGVDLARALAVFGMYIVHVGPMLSTTSGVGSWIRYLADGHSSVLFATLAGFSLMLIAGRKEPKTGLAGRKAKARIAIRAVVLLAFGTLLAKFYGDVIIIGFYGVYFLVAMLFLKLSGKTLAITAAALAIVGPQLKFVLSPLLSGSVTQTVDAYDPLEKLSGVGVIDLLITGFYPTIPWIAFVVAGMALGRVDLSAPANQRRLAALGAGLTVAAYGLSLLLAGKNALRSMAEDGSSSGSGSWSGSGSGSWSGSSKPPMDSGSFGYQPSVSDLFAAGPHSGTTFDIIGSVGIAVLVIVGATFLMDRLPRLRRLMAPVVAVGTMSLTAYVGHFVIMSWLSLPGGGVRGSWIPVLTLILGAIVFAAIWSRFFKRGPLEYLLNLTTKPAKYVK